MNTFAKLVVVVAVFFTLIPGTKLSNRAPETRPEAIECQLRNMEHKDATFLWSALKMIKLVDNNIAPCTNVPLFTDSDAMVSSSEENPYGSTFLLVWSIVTSVCLLLAVILVITIKDRMECLRSKLVMEEKPKEEKSNALKICEEDIASLKARNVVATEKLLEVSHQLNAANNELKLLRSNEQTLNKKMQSNYQAIEEKDKEISFLKSSNVEANGKLSEMSHQLNEEIKLLRSNEQMLNKKMQSNYQEIEEKDKEISILKSSNVVANGKLSEMSHQLNEEIKLLRSNEQMLNKKMQSNYQEIEEKDKEISILKSSNVVANGKLSEMSHQLNEEIKLLRSNEQMLNKKMQSNYQEIEEKDKEISILKSSNVVANGKLSEMSHQLNEEIKLLRSNEQMLNKKMQSNYQEIERKDKEISFLKSSNVEANGKLSEMSHQLNEEIKLLRSNEQTLNKKMQSNYQEIEEKDKEISFLKSSNVQANGKLSEMSHQLNEEIKLLRSNEQTLNKKMQSNYEEIESKDKEIFILKSSNVVANGKLSEVSHQLNAAHKEIKLLRSNVQTLNIKMQSNHEVIEKQNKEITSLIARNVRVSNQLHAAQNEIVQQRSNKQTLNESLQNNHQVIEELNKEIAYLKARNVSVCNEKFSVSQQLNAAQNEIKQLRSREQTLNKLLMNNYDVIEEQTNETAKLKDAQKQEQMLLINKEKGRDAAERLLNEGLSYFEYNQLPRAVTKLTESLQEHETADAYWIRGKLHLALGEANEALKDSQRATNMDKSFEGYYLLTAECYIVLGEPLSALKTLQFLKDHNQEIPTLFSYNYDVLLRKANHLHTWMEKARNHFPHSVENALYYLDQAHTLARGSLKIKLQLAQACALTERFERAQELIESILSVNRSADAQYVAGFTQACMGCYEEAAKHFQKMTIEFPEYKKAARAHLLLQQSVLSQRGLTEIKRGSYSKALSSLEKALELGFLDEHSYKVILHARSVAYLHLGYNKQANVEATRLLQLDHSHYAARVICMVTNMAQGNYSRVSSDLEGIKSAANEEFILGTQCLIEAATGPNHYDVLGLQKDCCSRQDIIKAYRKAALIHHPDKHSDASKEVQLSHEAFMKKINTAKQILENPTTKIIYDRQQENFANDLKYWEQNLRTWILQECKTTNVKINNINLPLLQKWGRDENC